MIGTHLGRLRLASLADGLSYLLLLGICVPLKHLANWPLGVQVIGRLHGLLFILLALAVVVVWWKRQWRLKWPVIIMLCAVLPLAPFWLDRKLAALEGAPREDESG